VQFKALRQQLLSVCTIRHYVGVAHSDLAPKVSKNDQKKRKQVMRLARKKDKKNVNALPSPSSSSSSPPANVELPTSLLEPIANMNVGNLGTEDIALPQDDAESRKKVFHAVRMIKEAERVALGKEPQVVIPPNDELWNILADPNAETGEGESSSSVVRAVDAEQWSRLILWARESLVRFEAILEDLNDHSKSNTLPAQVDVSEESPLNQWLLSIRKAN
jgi:hypothetical protein